MKRLHLSACLVLALATGPALADEDISKVNGGITAEAGQRYGDLDTVNGGIRIGDGAQTGDAETVNGGIKVGDDVRVGGIETVNGGVSVGSRTIVGKGIETVNGSVFVDRGSEVHGDIETVNGAIGLVATRLHGDIETVNGDITVGVNSQVDGGITVRKPSGFRLSLKPSRTSRVIIGPNAVVEGELLFEREVELYVHESARVGHITGATPRRFAGDVAPPAK